MISVPPLWDVLDRSALTIIDDVNAFDEREHLRLLEDLDCPLLFASVTPNELQRFPRTRRCDEEYDLDAWHALRRVTDEECIKRRASGASPRRSNSRARIRSSANISNVSRASSSSRARVATCRNSRSACKRRTASTAQQLRGDMADSAEHKKRNRRSGVNVYGTSTRVEEMRAFREGAPAILAATNLVGSGLDIPAADLIVITDSDAFGESEIEQLIGRVGRRERPSDAVLAGRNDVREESVPRDGCERPRANVHAVRNAFQLAALSTAQVICSMPRLVRSTNSQTSTIVTGSAMRRNSMTRCSAYGLGFGRSRVVDIASGTGLVAAELVGARLLRRRSRRISQAMCTKARDRVPGAIVRHLVTPKRYRIRG